MNYESRRFYQQIPFSSTVALPTAVSLFSLLVNANSALVDDTGKHTITNSGVTIDTTTFKFGGGSARFDGVSQYTLDGSSDFDFGTGDYTIDLWVMFNTVPLTDAGIITIHGGSPTFEILKTSANVIQAFGTGGGNINGTTVVTTATWYHIALTKASGNVRLFINGTQEGSTVVDASTQTTLAGYPQVGCENGAINRMDGWQDGLRIWKGTAAWTANFTPPTGEFSP